MKRLTLGNSHLETSEISLGCMRIANQTGDQAATLIQAALDHEIDYFDHADIYGDGRSEQIFAEAIGMTPQVREKIILQSKCGIRKGFFDFSKEHILTSVDQSLKNLQTEYLDVLLLHRPDTLVEPEEVAETFALLKESGKVRHFGVSNQKPMMIELLKKYLQTDIIINQLQFSITNTGMIDSGLNVNMKNASSINHDSDVLEYCRLHDITIQAWSPFQFGFFGGAFLDSDQFPQLNEKVNELADKYDVTNSAIAIAWILRHPAKIQPIVGTTNSERLKAICAASSITLTRPEWYQIYTAAGNVLP